MEAAHNFNPIITVVFPRKPFVFSLSYSPHSCLSKEKPLVRVTFPRKTTELREVVFLGKSRERVVFSALNNVARHSRNSKVIIQLHSPLFVEIQFYFFLLIWIRHDVSSLFVSSKPFETKDSNCVQKSTIV